MRTRYTTSDTGTWPAAVGSPSPQRIRWGAVFGGAVLGIALLALLTTLWFALAYGSNVATIRTNLEWYVGISAIVCLFLAGMMAGWLSGVHGAGSGFFNGVTIWALMLIATVTVGVPAIINVFNLGRIGTLNATTGGLLTQNTTDNVLWATFASILGGLIASGLGGMIGGALTRPANMHLMDQPVATRTVDDDDRPARPDTERTVVVRDDDDVRRVS
jgi:hypothetical protein